VTSEERCPFLDLVVGGEGGNKINEKWVGHECEWKSTADEELEQ
jgi:hypothetical protein